MRKRYNNLSKFYKEKFNSKVFKISLNANFSCPNIDGTRGYGGCIYCSGDFTNDKSLPLIEQFNMMKKTLHKKWESGKYIAYFQANTNTYDTVLNLKKRFEPFILMDNVIGLSIATRCDSISEEVLDYLTDLNKRTYLTIELGLQTIHESTSKLINRGHTLKEFHDMVLKLRERNINVVVHIINGLPYETKEMMIETIKYLNTLDIQGIKIHMLYISLGTKLYDLYIKSDFKLLTKNEYVDIVCDQLEYLKNDIVIHRITGDPKVCSLVEPTWLVKKFVVLNSIDKEMKNRNSYQGIKK